MAIMAAHMSSPFVFRFIGKILIKFSHGKSVYISSECYTKLFAFWLCFSLNIHNETRGFLTLFVDLSDPLPFDTKFQKHVFDAFMSLKFFEGYLRMFVELPSKFDYSIENIFVHCKLYLSNITIKYHVRHNMKKQGIVKYDK